VLDLVKPVMAILPEVTPPPAGKRVRGAVLVVGGHPRHARVRQRCTGPVVGEAPWARILRHQSGEAAVPPQLL
jgi:hypothetical protein